MAGIPLLDSGMYSYKTRHMNLFFPAKLVTQYTKMLLALWSITFLLTTMSRIKEKHD